MTGWPRVPRPGIRPERGDCYPEQWVGGSDEIGRPIIWEYDI